MCKATDMICHINEHICNVAGRILSRLRLILLMTAASFAFNANAASTPAPIVHVMVSSATNSETTTFLGSVGNSPFTFSASVERFGASAGSKGDLYLGVILPQQKGTLTWHLIAGMPSISGGLNAIVSGIDLTDTSTFTVSSVLNSQIEFSFTGQEPPGLYLVFALLVKSGDDPSDTRNWLGINIAPLVVE